MSFQNISRYAIAVAMLLALVTIPSFAQVVATDAYQVHAYHVNTVGGLCTPAVNNTLQSVDVINTGQIGSPIDIPTASGIICADIYIFNRDQEMLSCCSIPLTANELFNSELCDLLNNPLTGTVAPEGVIKIVADQQSRAPRCDASSIQNPVNSGLRAWRVTSNTTTNVPVSESAFASAPLTSQEQQFLGQACAFVQYLGSGKGLCRLLN